MPDIHRNRLIPLLGLLVMAIVGLVAVKMRHAGDGSTPVALKGIPKPSAATPDADSPADTIRTLTATVNATQAEQAKLAEQNRKLAEQLAQSKADSIAADARVTDAVVSRLGQGDLANSPLFAGVAAKFEELVRRYDPAGHRPSTVLAPPEPTGAEGAESGAPSHSSAPGAAASDIPPGLGFDANVPPLGSSGHQPIVTATPRSASAASTGELIWIEPMGAPPARGLDRPTGAARIAHTPVADAPVAAGDLTGPVGGALPDLSAGAQDVLNNGVSPAGVADNMLSAAPSALSPATASRGSAIPYFTIPENATLIGSTLMTAMIGRVPIDGKVSDPMPFKLLIGRTNLAANGIDVPEDISGMVVSGTAVGDWALSCNQGFIQSVTFVFDDGAIRTVSQRRSGANPGTSNGALGGGNLGWVSDERGTPCIAGQKITNAPAYLTETIGLKALASAGHAAALAQTTTSTNGLGGGTAALTGSVNPFMLGEAVDGGIGELTDWYKRRLTNSFDAVYVAPGLPTAVHIDVAIAIDKASDARRLDYGNRQRIRTARHALD